MLPQLTDNLRRYICEIAPSASRGRLVSYPQFMCATGVCAGYFTCFGSVRIASSLSWRTPYIIQAVLGAMLASFCLYIPSSPRWLLHKGRREEALRSLERLTIEKEEAEKDILAPISSVTQPKTGLQGYLEIFEKEYRGRTLLGLFMLGILQLSGIDGVLYVCIDSECC